MANEIMVTLESGIATAAPHVALKNEALQAHTNAIFELMNATKRNMFEIAARLLVIRNEELYTADGYKDVFDYAAKVLDYKRNFVYKLTNAAEKFIEANANGNGYVSIIVHDDCDYTVSQLVELNSLESDTVIALDENGVIAPEMSTKEIRETVKDYKNGVIDVEGNRTETETAESDESGENGESEGEETVDDCAIALVSIMTACDTLLADERIINNVNFAKKVKAFKKACEGFNL